MVKSLWLKSPGDQAVLLPLLEGLCPPILPIDSGREAARLMAQDPRVSVLILSDAVDESQVQQLGAGLAGRGLALEIICVTDRDIAPPHLAPLADQHDTSVWIAHPGGDRERFQLLVAQVCAKALAVRQLHEVRLGLFEAEGFLGPSVASRLLVRRLTRAASSQEAILIQGPEGCGKEMLARLLHAISPNRCLGPFLAADAVAVAAEDFAARLFGQYRDGLRSGESQEGLIHHAARGTLVLRNIEGATMATQMRLAEMLAQGRFVRVGATQPEPMDVQLVCTTRADLVALAREGRFRPDLLNELAGNVVEVPSLAARREDVAPLALHEIRRLFREYAPARLFPGLTPDAEELLASTAWPYDRHGLRHFIQRFVLLTGLDAERPVSATDLRPDLDTWLTAARTRKPDFCDVETLRLARCLGLRYDRVYHEALAACLTVERRRRSKQEIAELFGKSTRWLEITMNDLSQWMLANNHRTPEELKRDLLWTRRFRQTPSDTPDPDAEDNSTVN